MKRIINGLFFFVSFILFFSACQKKDWDEYYGRPADLAPPIYQQLQARGNFTNLLAVIDKSGYKEILGKAGSWTMFAPNDQAFEKYFQEKGISSVADINVETAQKIALYGLIYNPYRKDQLSFYQTPVGPDTNGAFRRTTAYYDFVYSENGRKVVNSSRNGINYVAGENNNKHIPYFIDEQLTANNIDHSDYSKFYPGKTFKGFHVAQAEVVAADIPAENGIIHEIDEVIEALPNIDQYIASNPDYSKFKALLDKYVVYVPNADYTKRYHAVTGNSDSVFIKAYQSLAFAPNNEGYLGGQTDGQNMSWSIAVPRNAELDTYVAELLKYYGGSFDNAPASILLDFINSHMWVVPLWPSGLQDIENSQLEVATFTQSNIIENKVLSNGNFFGVNKPQEADVFRTVYGHAYLNPDYAFMTRAIDGSADVKDYVTAPNAQTSMFLMSDADLMAAGFDYDPNTSQWGYAKPGSGLNPSFGGQAGALISRLIRTSVLTEKAENFAGEGIIEAFNGEYIRYNNGKLYASGNIAEGTEVAIKEVRSAVNGNAYVTDGMLKFAEDNINPGYTLKTLANSTDPAISSSYSHFYKYLEKSALWIDAAKTIIDGVELGGFYTLFVPTNAAIEEAVKAGRLPGDPITGAPNFNASTQTAAQKDAVERMIKYSIMNMPINSSVAVDGKKEGAFTTILKNAINESRILTVRYAPNKAPGTMELVDDTPTPNVATVNLPVSNNISNRALIHSINKVLKF
ncbi:fasciclin domain-containing protein [Paradesertivirga mongoliensis]|uniref:Fasciclin domain-containing protein n=1 Tax=Paradesertivirga mongoliensis TaxID=2100740 RepID=A0ABW4ZJR7_9SPHI|nr:fasciclin domain-containing protein [Pedobacter mongoliensis]